jgi:hypothetical protein
MFSATDRNKPNRNTLETSFVEQGSSWERVLGARENIDILAIISIFYGDPKACGDLCSLDLFVARNFKINGT